MKTLLTFIYCLAATICFSQNFEGIMKWSIKSEITDPQMKAQMEEAQKKMNDPATQAQMKQMQEQMNSPEMKKMMEQNPEMKTQMENAMKMMQGGDMSSMTPKGMTVKVKKGNTLTIMEGGMMAGNETLYRKDKNQTFLINESNKTYSLITQPHASGNDKHGEVKVTKTSETQKILGYTCTKIIVTVTDKGNTITQNFWTTTEIKDMDFKSQASSKMSSNLSMFYEGMDGVPLKMEMTTPQMKMVMEATELKKTSLPDSAFEIPAGFTEVKLPGY